MADLIAQGPVAPQRWRRSLPENVEVILGRGDSAWSIPWDTLISRNHAALTWNGRQLRVVSDVDARNPVFYDGQPRSVFDVAPGEHFVIGDTVFSVAAETAAVTLDLPRPVSEQAYSPRYLRQLSFRDAATRIDALSRLPEMIATAASENELAVRVVTLLLAGIARADAAAVVCATDVDAPINILRWDRRGESRLDFTPSERLIRQAVASGQSVIHVWDDVRDVAASFTQAENTAWAFCTPAITGGGDAWAFYVTGGADAGEDRATVASDLQDELKYAELAASTIVNLRALESMQRRNASLTQFLSPTVVQALAGRDPDEVLAPRPADVAVLFCDLRGFSQQSEKHSNELMLLLNRVSEALGVMTHQILSAGGVVGDFHGDSAMGFWGWPLEQPDASVRACQAAMSIRREFATTARDENHPLSDFRVAIGIASGPAVAGKIGTVDQVKVSVFGPVVNLAARLESMTRILHAPILIDEATADAVRSADAGIARVRRVAQVIPYGMSHPVVVSQLVPPLAEFPEFSDEHLESYEAALDCLIQGDWTEAFRRLHDVPADDHVKDFLTGLIAQHHRTPPADWNGVITLKSK